MFDSLNEKQRATAEKVMAAAEKYGVPKTLAFGMAMQESGFDQNKHSKTGPVGVMMLGRKAAKDMGVNRYDEDENIDGGMRYARQLLDKHNGDWDKTLVAYHDGPNSPYFKGGEMSPEAKTHIQKVKGYADMAGPTSTQFSTDVEDIEPLDLSGINDTTQTVDQGRDMDVTDAMSGSAGALAGAMGGAERKRTEANVRAQTANAHSVRDANRAAQLQHQEQLKNLDRQDKYALELRKAAMEHAAAVQKAADQTAQKAAGQDPRNWIRGQFGGDIADVEGRNVLSQAEAQQAGTQGVGRVRQAQAMMPGAAPDPTTGLWLGQDVLATRPAAPAPQAPKVPNFPMPKPLLRPTAPVPQPVPHIEAGSRIGSALNAGTGAIMGQQAKDAILAAQQNDWLRAGLDALTSGGAAAATYSHNPKTKAIGAGVAVAAKGADYLKDYIMNKINPQPPAGQ
jgi:hypothetical protein